MATWIATAPPGLEPIVDRELRALGREGRVVPGGVEFTASPVNGAHLAARLRTPTRLMLRVATGRTGTLAQLAALVRSADWRPFLDRRAKVDVVATSRRSRLRHRKTIAAKVQNALRDACRRLPAGARYPRATQRVQVRIDDDRAELSIDAGGALLHLRGWRPQTRAAPLRETTAACLLVAAGWSGDEPLIDPFCGAGTIPIEAALLAMGRSPGVGRRYACEEWPALVRSPLPNRGPAGRGPHTGRRPSVREPSVLIIGADRDPEALEVAASNAARARVRLTWQRSSAEALPSPGAVGVVVTNPPWGHRLGGDARGAYRALGAALRGPLAGWRAVFLAPRAQLARLVHGDVQALTSFRSGGKSVGVYALDAGCQGETRDG